MMVVAEDDALLLERTTSTTSEAEGSRGGRDSRPMATATHAARAPPRLVAVTEGRGGVATGVASLGHRCATKEVGAAGAPRGAATEVVGKDDADGMST